MPNAETQDETEPTRPGLNAGDPLVMDFKTPDKTGERPWQQMAIDGDPVFVREPKGAFFLDLSQRLKTPEQQAGAIAEVLEVIFDEESAVYVWGRLRDDDDDLDADEVGKIIENLQELWGKGRGGSSNGSPHSARPRTKRSTARRR